MKNDQARLADFYRRFAEALKEGCQPSVRVIRKPNPEFGSHEDLQRRLVDLQHDWLMLFMAVTRTVGHRHLH